MSLPDTLGLIGTTILDKYAVESVVGEGGFAVVYRAQHLLWKRPVAVKVFKALGEVPHDQREKLLEGFIQEGALLADLSERSAAICQARDVGMLKTPKGDEVPYIPLNQLNVTVAVEHRRAHRRRWNRDRPAVQPRPAWPCACSPTKRVRL